MRVLIANVVLFSLACGTLDYCTPTLPFVEPYITITDEETYVRTGANTVYPLVHILPVGTRASILGIGNVMVYDWYFIRLQDGATGFIHPSSGIVTGDVNNLRVFELPSFPAGVNVWLLNLELDMPDEQPRCDAATPIKVTIINTSFAASVRTTVRVALFNADSGELLQKNFGDVPVIDPMQRYDVIANLQLHMRPDGNYVVRAVADLGNKLREVDEGDNARELRFTLACGNLR